jgi:hypothetical protein
MRATLWCKALLVKKMLLFDAELHTNSSCCCCLQETAKFLEVAALAEKHVINVFIGGSRTSLFCNITTVGSFCSTLYFGYTCGAGYNWSKTRGYLDVLNLLQ